MKGLMENGVDEEGWSYAVDFPWIQWPPVPGSGKFRKVRTTIRTEHRTKKFHSRTEWRVVVRPALYLWQVRDYVRRRRWFRTRRFAGIPLQDSPSRRLLPTSAPSKTSLLTKALANKPSEDEKVSKLTPYVPL